MAERKTGIIKVGRYEVTDVRKERTYEPIVVMTYSHEKKWAPLSPYYLRDPNGCIMENVWQFSKVYTNIPEMPGRNHRGPVHWRYGAETHYVNGTLLPSYWIWRKRGFAYNAAVRYPVGFNHRTKCLFSILNESDQTPMDYITARKKIYAPLYCAAAKQQPEFFQLKQKWETGGNLLILEVDGPHQESLPHYQKTYGTSNIFIENNAMIATQETLAIMLNDPKHPFGHGYCLAMALLGLEQVLDG
jgi:hypothetical protein